MLLVFPKWHRRETDEGGNTTLHVAAELGNEKIVRALLLDGVTCKDKLNKIGVAPLHLAIRGGHLPVVKALLLAGATAHLRRGPDDDYEPTPENEGALIDVDDDYGYSPLMLAVCSKKNRLAMMKVLLRHGAIVDDGKDMGKSALHHPAMEDDPDAVDLLLEAGASIPDEDGNPTYSPVSSAAVRLAYGMALSLLEHGSKVNVDEHDGETPLALVLSMAQAPGCAKMVDLSLRWGADETGEQRIDGASCVTACVFLWNG